MVRDLPDFVKGLVNIAQRGRSLGIHLILATQRPSGVVSSEIRANTNLRIALRVTDSGESQDVINSGEAAGISQRNPGRAYVRLGQNSLVPFQSGRVGGRRLGATASTVPAPWAVAVGWERLGEPLPARPRAAAAPAEVETDLTGLVTAIREADREMGIPRQHSPWLPPLPEALVTRDLPAPAPTGYDLQPVAYGVVDLPAQQARQPLVIDPATLGHLHIVGSPRQGRSQTLRTIAGAMALAHSADKLHMYGIDCGNGALLPIEGLPHCGAITQRTQPDRVARLLARLTKELTRRQEMLAARGSADLPELRRALPEAERPPHIVLFIDRWEVFDKQLGEYDSGNLLNSVMTLLRDGASVGIHLLMTGDRALFSSRVNGSTEDKLVLKLNEKSEYGQIGITQRNVPDEIPPGRAFRAADKAEVQIALLTDNPEGQAQAGHSTRSPNTAGRSRRGSLLGHARSASTPCPTGSPGNRRSSTCRARCRRRGGPCPVSAATNSPRSAPTSPSRRPSWSPGPPARDAARSCRRWRCRCSPSARPSSSARPPGHRCAGSQAGPASSRSTRSPTSTRRRSSRYWHRRRRVPW